MLDIPKMMSRQFNILVNEKEIFEKYCNNGYTFFYNPNNIQLKILYYNKEYTITIINIDDILYWHLSPYNHSVFNTRIDLTGEAFKLVLFAIKEDKELYS